MNWFICFTIQIILAKQFIEIIRLIQHTVYLITEISKS